MDFNIGIYSPISQNERHVNILREILVKEGLIRTLPIKSLVVIANPKTIVDLSKTPKAIKSNIVKYDQVNKFLKMQYEYKGYEHDMLEQKMYNIANYLIDNHKPAEFDYEAKYSLENSIEDSREEYVQNNSTKVKVHQQEKKSPRFIKSDDDIRSALKEFRLAKSREDGIKAYLIFNNEEMEALIKENPKTEGELLKIKGFGVKKVEKYGADILACFK